MEIIMFIFVLFICGRLAPFFNQYRERRAAKNNAKFEAHWRRQSEQWINYLAARGNNDKHA